MRNLLSEYADILGTPTRPGQVQVVLVGWHPPLRQVALDSLPWIKVQARISRSGLSVPEGDIALVGLVSLDYGKSLRWRGRGELTESDRRTLSHIATARRTLPGRLVRAYNVPPTAEVYRLLLSSGVDLIGTKELDETAAILSRCCN